jgi:acyl-CoA reductase-like NAD-dependent aldehyde dehydrogenase
MNAYSVPDLLGAEAAAFLGESHLNLVGDRWVASLSGETMDVVDPATGATITRIASSGPADVDAAVKAARQALETGP